MRIYGVTMSPKPNTGIKVSIRKPDGTTLVSPFDVGSSGTFMEPVSTPVTGTYTIVLDGQSTYKGKATVALSTVGAVRRPGDAGRGRGAACADARPERHRHLHRHDRPPRSIKLAPHDHQRQRPQLGARVGAEA